MSRLRDFTISPAAYARVALFALAALVLIVLTGVGVRVTESGLGCPDWPKCFGRVIPPLTAHSAIEFGNRLITGAVGLAVIAAAVLAARRRPYRSHLAILGALLPLGVVLQAVLGGLVVRYHLAPGLVIGHFILSMALLDAGFALAWCARYEPPERPRSHDAVSVWAVRGLVPLGQLTILLGTFATGAGPHRGEYKGQIVGRFDWRGSDTLNWLVTRHGVIAALYGIAAVAVWFVVRRAGADGRARRPLTLVCGLLAAQGVLGILQYRLHLPAELVWLHVALATGTWVSTLWSVGAAGRLAPSAARMRSASAVAA